MELCPIAHRTMYTSLCIVYMHTSGVRVVYCRLGLRGRGGGENGLVTSLAF